MNTGNVEGLTGQVNGVEGVKKKINKRKKNGCLVYVIYFCVHYYSYPLFASKYAEKCMVTLRSLNDFFSSCNFICENFLLLDKKKRMRLKVFHRKYVWFPL